MNYLRGKYTPALYIAPSSLLPQHPNNFRRFPLKSPPLLSFALSLDWIDCFSNPGEITCKKGSHSHGENSDRRREVMRAFLLKDIKTAHTVG